jgi:hypothetical protein
MASDVPDKSEDLGDETPEAAEFVEPSPEKDPGEEPKAAKAHDPEPDHEAVGIGIPGQPQVGENHAD